jgi:hypothetical protein
MGLWRSFRSWYRMRQRKLDCEILWPSLVMEAEGDIRWAQNAMLEHAMTDPAWRDELTELEIYSIIAALTANESAGNRSPSKYSAPSTAP